MVLQKGTTGSPHLVTDIGTVSLVIKQSANKTH